MSDLYQRIFGPLPPKINPNDLKCCGNCGWQYGTICHPYRRSWRRLGVCENWELANMPRDRYIPPRRKPNHEMAVEIAARVALLAAEGNEDMKKLLESVKEVGE